MKSSVSSLWFTVDGYESSRSTYSNDSRNDKTGFDPEDLVRRLRYEPFTTDLRHVLIFNNKTLIEFSHPKMTRQQQNTRHKPSKTMMNSLRWAGDHHVQSGWIRHGRSLTAKVILRLVTARANSNALSLRLWTHWNTTGHAKKLTSTESWKTGYGLRNVSKIVRIWAVWKQFGSLVTQIQG